MCFITAARAQGTQWLALGRGEPIRVNARHCAGNSRSCSSRFGVQKLPPIPRIFLMLGQSQSCSSLDDLISSREQRRRHIEPEGLGGLQVDHQLVLGRRLHREVGGLLASKDAVNVGCCAAILV